MTAVPAATRSGTRAAAAPWGRARKTASTSGERARRGPSGRSSRGAGGSRRSGRGRGRVPTSPTSSTFGWRARRRTSSAPTYPVAPIDPDADAPRPAGRVDPAAPNAGSRRQQRPPGSIESPSQSNDYTARMHSHAIGWSCRSPRADAGSARRRRSHLRRRSSQPMPVASPTAGRIPAPARRRVETPPASLRCHSRACLMVAGRASISGPRGPAARSAARPPAPAPRSRRWRRAAWLIALDWHQRGWAAPDRSRGRAHGRRRCARDRARSARPWRDRDGSRGSALAGEAGTRPAAIAPIGARRADRLADALDWRSADGSRLAVCFQRYAATEDPRASLTRASARSRRPIVGAASATRWSRRASGVYPATSAGPTRRSTSGRAYGPVAMTSPSAS